jgi:hypothetical protein
MSGTAEGSSVSWSRAAVGRFLFPAANSFREKIKHQRRNKDGKRLQKHTEYAGHVV